MHLRRIVFKFTGPLERNLLCRDEGGWHATVQRRGMSRREGQQKEGERRIGRKERSESRDKERRKRLVPMRRSCCRVTRVKQPFYRLPVGVSCTHVHPRPRCSLCTSAEILIHPRSFALSFLASSRVTGSWKVQRNFCPIKSFSVSFTASYFYAFTRYHFHGITVNCDESFLHSKLSPRC